MLASVVASIEQSISINIGEIFDSVSVKQQKLDIALVRFFDVQMTEACLTFAMFQTGAGNQLGVLETELLGIQNVNPPPRFNFVSLTNMF